MTRLTGRMEEAPGTVVAVTLGGNATVRIEGAGICVMTDPWLTDNIGPLHRLRPSAFNSADLAAADVVLISHAHPDHLDPDSLISITSQTPILCPAGTPLDRLRRAGVGTPCALAAWESWQHGPL